MGKQYQQLNQALRDRIAALKREHCSNRAIADVLGIHHTTVGRELRRNCYGRDGRTSPSKHGVYDAASAQHKAYVRRRYATYQGRKIHKDHRLESFVKTNIQLHWNPDEMAGYMKDHCDELGFYASKTSIYEWFNTVYGEPYKRYLYGHRTGRRPRKKREGLASHIPNRVSVAERPETADDRHETGHYEFDAIVSSKASGSTAALAVVQERSTRLLVARRVDSLAPDTYAEVIVSLTQHHAGVRSFTTDNGLENRSHQFIAQATYAPVYFTDPYSSWQKGGVENGNKLIRWDYPKGTDFSRVGERELYESIQRINKKPRRCLGYKSSLQLAKEKGVLP